MNIKPGMRKHFKQQLLKRQGSRCAYCGILMRQPGEATFDYVFPKAEFPELSAAVDNIVMACRQCNARKGATAPTDADGNSRFLVPGRDDWNDHIAVADSGEAISKTPLGAQHLQFFPLNRPELIDQRRADRAARNLIRQYDETPTDAYGNCLASLATIEVVNKSSNQQYPEPVAGYVRRMLYSNAITALEAYLVDSFAGMALANDDSLAVFVEKYEPFTKTKFSLSKVFTERREIRTKSVEAIGAVMWHNLPTVKAMFQNIFGVDMPSIGELMEAVVCRHDLVHRNGKVKGKDTVRLINEDDVAKLCGLVKSFVDGLEANIKATVDRDPDEA